LAEKIDPHRKAQEPRSRETRYLSTPYISISAAGCVHGDFSGRDGQRLVGVRGVVDFVRCPIIMRLMNPTTIVEVEM
jgi:hypothetical protein